MSLPLEGIRVLELARVLAGPYCGMVLGDLGADVIKVERPLLGDDLRHWGPPFMPDGESTYFLAVNRNKRSIALDLATPAGVEVLHVLTRQSDVIVENFRPGVMNKLGLGAAELAALNPRIVHCAISAYGPEGPLASSPGYDIVLQAMSGLMSVTGEPDRAPVRVGVAVVDLAAGFQAALGICAGLFQSLRRSEGTSIQISLLDVALSLLPNLTAGYLLQGEVPERLGNAHPNASPYGLFGTSNGQMVIAIGNDAQWRRLCAAMGRLDIMDDPKWRTNAARIKQRETVETTIAQWCSEKLSEDVSAILTDASIPHGPIYTIPEALEADQVTANGILREIQHPTAGLLRLVGPALRFPGDALIRHPPPRLDANRSEILSSIGVGSREADQLARDGAFGNLTQPGQEVESAQF